MANSDRLRKDRKGRVFIPMNVEGGGQEEGFLTSKKVIALVLMALGVVLTLSFLSSAKATVQGYIMGILFLLFIYQYVIRYVIFEEKYYYKVYRKMQLNKNPTPAIFWDIASIKDTDEGAVMVYSDMKMGIIVKLERDTIVGKSEDFVETHFDALSEFYKELNLKDLCFIQINIMEQAGKDNRATKLDELITKTKNRNIANLLELQLGYMKNITRETLYESDYILIYTRQLSRADYLISDAVECLYKLMEGAFIGFRVLNAKEIKEMPKDIYDVKYFDYAEATMNLFKQGGMQLEKAFDISEIEFEQGEPVKIGNKENLLLHNLASYVKSGTLGYGEWTVKEALEGKYNNKFNIIGGNTSKQTTANSKQQKPIVDDTVEDDDIIIDLDNVTFGGEYGIGMNAVNDELPPTENVTKPTKSKFKFGKK